MVINKNYNTVVFIGNGFDLNLGLKTSYSDFLSSSNFEQLIKSNNNLAKYLKSQANLRNWIDIECELEKYSLALNVGGIAYKKYEQEFKDLKLSLCQYITSLSSVELNMDSMAEILLKNLLNQDYLIIDFNYTKSTEEVLLSLGETKEKIENRLFKIHDTVERNKIIFGVEDSASIRDEHVFLLKSYNDNYNAVNLSKIMKYCNNVYFFGHSLGKTDHPYFNDFFKELSREDYREGKKNINLFYHGDDSYRELMIQLMVLINKKLSVFKRNSNFSMINTAANV